VKTTGSLVDTSVWIDFFRGVAPVRAFLNDLILKNRVFICGPIFFELLQGIKSSEEKSLAKEALLSLPYLEITLQVWEGAAYLSRDLRTKGVTLPLTDLLIGQLAKANNLEVISFDPHFDQIPDLIHHKP
jgi:predicted nucleic acid-binding protein